MHYYLWTIGCQMNFADSRRAAEELEHIGFRETDQPQAADLILLNTCVVRQSAQDKVTGRLTSLLGLKRRKPGLRIALMGCYVDEVPRLERRFPWVDAFIKPSDVPGVVAFASQQVAEPGSPDQQSPARDLPSPVSVGVPISCGCDHLCTYCIVRLRRGSEVSRPLEEIAAEVEDLVQRGAREVTLLGQNVDSYGRDLPPLHFGRGMVDGTTDLETGTGQQESHVAGIERTSERPPDLADLLHAVHQIERLKRIRFLTSHPADMTDRLIETAAHLPKVCEHIEVPIQSGDDAVLRRMGRGYTVDQYRNLVARIRRAFQHGPSAAGVALATDVIVGFPGETEAQFEATYRLLEELRFDMVHVAAYSPRPGTPAHQLLDDVPSEEKERRRKAVDDLQEHIVGEINARYLDRTVEVLVEERRKGKWRGRTRTNKLVFFEVDGREWAGQLAPVRISWTGPWSMLGEVKTA